jgi:hypothetical protein
MYLEVLVKNGYFRVNMLVAVGCSKSWNKPQAEHMVGANSYVSCCSLDLSGAISAFANGCSPNDINASMGSSQDLHFVI